MTKFSNFSIGTVIVILSNSLSIAAPCNVGTTTNISGLSKDTSSDVDGSTTGAVSPGAKGESPGTVGAMNNVGVSTKDDGSKKAPEVQPVMPGSDNY
jgi:hypothetical protein